jgi:hypothetical protein
MANEAGFAPVEQLSPQKDYVGYRTKAQTDNSTKDVIKRDYDSGCVRGKIRKLVMPTSAIFRGGIFED